MATIFALSSAAGVAGVAVVRISGPKVPLALQALGVKTLPKPRYAHCCRLYDEQQQLLDEALLLYFPAPP